LIAASRFSHLSGEKSRKTSGTRVVEESCAAEIPEGSSESGQDYAAVESAKAVGSQFLY